MNGCDILGEADRSFGALVRILFPHTMEKVRHCLVCEPPFLLCHLVSFGIEVRFEPGSDYRIKCFPAVTVHALMAPVKQIKFSVIIKNADHDGFLDKASNVIELMLAAEGASMIRVRQFHIDAALRK